MGRDPLPDNVFTLPEGAVRLADGTVVLPAGAALPEGAVRLTDGTVQLPEGVIALPEGTVKNPFDEGAAYAGLYDENGNLIQRAEDARKEPGKTDFHADTPDHARVDTPVRQPVLVGAGARRGDGLGDVGRAENNLPGSGTADRAPGGTANHMPSNNLDSNTPAGRGGDGTPVGSNTPASHGDVGDRTAGAPDNASGGRGHSDTSTSGTTHNVPGTSTVDNGTRGAEAAAHRAEYEAAREKPTGTRTPEERAAITREHVRLANEDPAWRAQHYDKWGIGKRNNAESLVDGQLLPKLIEKPDGSWMSANELPYASSEDFLLGDLVRDRVTVDPHRLTHLDEVSAKRIAGMDLNNAQKAFDATPTDETARALADAQQHFDATVGPRGRQRRATNPMIRHTNEDVSALTGWRRSTYSNTEGGS